MSDLFTFRERMQSRAPLPRWQGDPFPVAFVDYHVARRAESNAWQRVADLAQRQANAARVMRHLLVGTEAIERAVAEADALMRSNEHVHLAYRAAEQAVAPVCAAGGPTVTVMTGNRVAAVA
jgi:hypothetical protein